MSPLSWSGGDSQVGADLGHVDEVELDRGGDGRDTQIADGRWSGSEQSRSEVRDNSVDEPGTQECRRQRRSAFEPDTVPTVAEEYRQGMARIAGSQAKRLGRVIGCRGIGRYRAHPHHYA
jgi:hypothetical protein